MSEPSSESRKALSDIDKIINTCSSCKRSLFDDLTPTCRMCEAPPEYPLEAPNGQIFVCGACGKLSKTLLPNVMNAEDYDRWDESCMFNAVLCFDTDKGGPYEAVPGYPPGRRKGRRIL